MRIRRSRPHARRFAFADAFHRLVARFYEHEENDAMVRAERRLCKASGRLGRADVFLWVANDFSYATIIETKWTDWDALDRRDTWRQNLARHRRQVWSYIDGTVGVERAGDKREIHLDATDVTAGLVYPKAPRSRERREQIETSLGERAISVVWFNEAPPNGTPARRAWDAMRRGQLFDHRVAAVQRRILSMLKIRSATRRT